MITPIQIVDFIRAKKLEFPGFYRQLRLCRNDDTMFSNEEIEFMNKIGDIQIEHVEDSYEPFGTSYIVMHFVNQNFRICEEIKKDHTGLTEFSITYSVFSKGGDICGTYDRVKVLNVEYLD